MGDLVFCFLCREKNKFMGYIKENTMASTFYTPNTYPYNANDPNDIVYRGDRAGVTQMYSPYQCGVGLGGSTSQFWFLGTRRPNCQGLAVPLNCSAPDDLAMAGSSSTCQPQQRSCATMYASN